MKLLTLSVILVTTPVDWSWWDGKAPSAAIVHEYQSDLFDTLSCYATWDADLCEALLRRLAAESDNVKVCLKVGRRLDCVPIEIKIPEPEIEPGPEPGLVQVCAEYSIGGDPVCKSMKIKNPPSITFDKSGTLLARTPEPFDLDDINTGWAFLYGQFCWIRNGTATWCTGWMR